MNEPESPIRLTQLAKRAGCAAKQPPGYLLPLLGLLPPITDPNVLVGSATPTTRPSTSSATSSRSC